MTSSYKQYSNSTAKGLGVSITDTLLVISIEIYLNIQYLLLLKHFTLAALCYKMDWETG